MSLLILFLLVILFIFVIGICVGSFLNVVVLRAFSDESIVLPPSKCPLCQTKLKWYHNVPIFSYMFLKGKCAFCKEPISFQYPVIELITGILFVAIFFWFDKSLLNAIFIAVFVSVFIVLAATDLKEKVIFDKHAYFLVGAGLIYNLFNIGHLYIGDKVISFHNFSVGINNSFIASILGIIIGILIMEIFARMGYIFAGTRAFGEGDSYIAAGLGAIFGYGYLLTALLYAFIIQLALTIPVFIRKLYLQKDYKTFSAFMLFLLLIIVMKWIDYSDYSNSIIVFGFFTLLLIAVGIYFCIRILTGLKDKENMTYLPFGPAMVLGSLVLLFTM